MTLLNAEVAGALDQLADLLELEGANPFRVRAYRNAARTVLVARQDCANAGGGPRSRSTTRALASARGLCHRLRAAVPGRPGPRCGARGQRPARRLDLDDV